MTRDLPQVCAVYGAGTFGRELADDLTDAGVKVVAIVDRARTEAHGMIPVIHPDEFADAASTPLVIGVFNQMYDPDELYALGQAAGHPEVLLPTEARLALGRAGVRRTHYWLADDVGVFDGCAGHIAQARALLSDSRSRELFDALVEYRMTGRTESPVTPHASDRPYLPHDVAFFGPGEVHLIDAGAYDGDTITGLLDAGVALASVLAFEPDPENFDKLSRTVSDLHIPATVLPLGVSGQTAQLRFHSSDAAGALTAEGEELVQCVSLDDMLFHSHPTHIKMDIEGAELAALNGMNRIVETAESRLAVSVYHQPHDLWDIPLEVQRLWPGRPMFLRQHGHFGFDTVLYVMDRPA